MYFFIIKTFLFNFDTFVHANCFFLIFQLLLTCFIGGEKCPSLQVMLKWNVPKDVRIYNLYGISEVSCWAALSKINFIFESIPSTFNGEEVAETPPNQETQCFIHPMTDTFLKIVPLDDYIGEMYIGKLYLLLIVRCI